MNLKEHIKAVAERYNTNLTEISKALGTTRNSFYIKLKNESIKLVYLNELSEVMQCNMLELIPPPDGFEHRYKKDKYLGLFKTE